MVGKRGVRKMMPNTRLIVLPDGSRQMIKQSALRAGRRSTLQDPVQPRKVDEDGRVLAFCECCGEFVPYWPMRTKELDMRGVVEIRLSAPPARP